MAVPATGDFAELSPSRAAQAVVSNAATNIGLAGIGFVTGTLSARILGPVGRGELAAIQVWPNFIACFAFLGLSEAVAYFSAVTPRASREFVVTAGAVALISATAAGLTAYFVLPSLMRHQPAYVVEAARRYLLILPALAVPAVVHPPLRATGRFGLWNVIRAVPQCLWLLVIAWAMLTGAATAHLMAWAYVVSLGIAAGPIAAVSLAFSPGHAGFAARSVKPLLRYGLSSVGGMVSQALNVRLDQMLIATLLPSRDLGLYVAAVAWSNLTMPLPLALSFVVVPAIATKHQAGSARFAQVCRLGAALSAVTVLALLPVTPVGMRLLFGKPFAEATTCALILVVASGFAGFNLVANEVLKGVKRPGDGSMAELVGLAVTVLGLLVALPRFGYTGAAWVSLASYASTSVALVVFSGRVAPVKIADLLIPKRSDAATLREIVLTAIDRYRTKARREMGRD